MLQIVFDNQNKLGEIIEWILIIEESVSKLFQGFEEAIEVHLTVFTPSQYTLINDVVMAFHYDIVGHAWVPRQLLELLVCDKIVAAIPS